MRRGAVIAGAGLTALLLAACSGEAGDPAAQLSGDPAEKVECAVAGASGFTPVCTLERLDDGLVVRHPDGGFRRLAFGEGDNRIRPADGAEAVRWRELADGRLEVVIGQDRYLLRLEAEPADVASPTPADPAGE